MSMNIFLEATRDLTTKSGRKVVDHKKVNYIGQTPSDVTYAILEKNTFEDRFNAYCDWVETRRSDDDGYWFAVYEFQTEETIDFYRKYNDSDYILDHDVRDDYVDRIVMKGEEDFNEILESLDENLQVLALIHMRPRPVREVLRLIIDKLREEEYELEWGMW
jgi:hypothetical protein